MHNFGTLLRFELRKIFSGRITVAALITSALMLFIISWQDYLTMPWLANSWEDELFLDGTVMDDSFFQALRTVYDEEWEYPEDSPYRFAARYVNWVMDAGVGQESVKGQIEVNELSSEDFYVQREHLLDIFKEPYFLSEEEENWWREQENAVDKPFEYKSIQGLLNMWDSYKWTFVLASLVIGLCLSTTFAGEKARRTDALIYSSKHGKKRLFEIKLVSGIIFLWQQE